MFMIITEHYAADTLYNSETLKGNVPVFTSNKSVVK